MYIYTHLFAISNKITKYFYTSSNTTYTHTHTAGTQHDTVCATYSTVPLSYSKLLPRKRRTVDINRFCIARNVTVATQQRGRVESEETGYT